MAVPINAHVSLLLSRADDSYTLPADLLQIRDAVEALDRAARTVQFPLSSNELELRQDLARKLREAALSGALATALDAGEGLPLNVAPVVRHREELALATEQRKVIDSAASSLASTLEATVRATHGAIIAGGLAPALRETVDQARPLVDALGGREPSRGGVFDGPPKVRAAFADLEALAERYSIVRKSYGDLLTFLNGTLERDRRRLLLSEFTVAGLSAGWPEWADIKRSVVDRGSTVLPTPPWPDDPVGRLVWIVQSGVETWTPTPEELADALAEADELLRTTQRVS